MPYETLFTKTIFLYKGEEGGLDNQEVDPCFDDNPIFDELYMMRVY